MKAEISFDMAMCGEVFVSVPPAYDEIAELLGGRLIHAGWAERDEYVDLLNRASVVLSTADQEFFGIGITEAVAAGAQPVFPNRLVYPERIHDFNCEPARSLYDTPGHAVDLISEALRSAPGAVDSAVASDFAWDKVAPRYDTVLERLHRPL
jgi:glycosyltransferase involved in cell wall biosynthesis